MAGRLTVALDALVETHGLGRVYVAETGYVLRRNPDTVRAPDLSFVSREREKAMGSWRGFISGPPDLAVEVRSPDDTMRWLTLKAVEYLEAGARLVWIVDPITRAVRVHRPGQSPVTLTGDVLLDGGDLLPGFNLPLSRLFAED